MTIDPNTLNPIVSDAERAEWKCELPLSYEVLKAEAKLMFGEEDEWGTVMQLWFGICAELHFRDPDLVPSDWSYRPGAGSYDDPRETDDFHYYTFRLADVDALLRLGKLLSRYADRLKAAGKDY